MELQRVNLNIDAFANKDIDEICRQFQDTEVELAGMDKFFDQATHDMQGTDYSELKYLFINGIRLGVFLSKNEHLIPKI